VFLDHLFSDLSDRDGGDRRPASIGFPVRFLCTHEIARRLLPELPRRGLRALAGYFGLLLPERKRATPHVVATARIWSALLEMLEDRFSIATLDELLTILDREPPARRLRFSYPLSREKRLRLTAEPGIYRFLNGNGDVLYVGKAASLKHRVNSYYRKRRAGEKLLELVSQVRDVDVTVTATAVEAALLEVDEIKRLAPCYNRALRRREGDLWFLSGDLTVASGAAPGGSHWVGPLPDRRLAEGLVALGEMARGGDDAVTLGRRLGPAVGRTEPGALIAGIRRFMAKHAGHAHSLGGGPVALLSLGAKLASERLAGGEADEGAREPGNDGRLDAQEVLARLEEMVIGAARLSRRARWFALLMECAILWRPESGGDRRALVLERGQVRCAVFLPSHAVPPVPDGSRPGCRERMAALDRATYDRLSVLSSELKRLSSSSNDDRDLGLEVVLDRGRRLDRARLARVLARV
jgi:DNA polymerase-3 subunit epsilon